MKPYSLKVLFFPQDQGNPYQHLLSEKLKDFGVEVGYYHKLPTEKWLLRNRNNFQVLHFHWPQTSYYRGKNIFLRAISLLWFVERLLLSRLLGYKIVWTAHNILPHESPCPVIDIIARYALVLMSNDIIAHCNYAKSKIRKKFQRKKRVHVIPHGNYTDIYSSALSKSGARKLLSLDDDVFIYLFFGNIRPYKGVENLIRAFKQINDEKSVLLIAGRCIEMDRTKLLGIIENDPRIKMFNDFTPQENHPLFFKAADCFVAPFTDVLTSGSVVLGLSFGLPAVVPALGCLPELIDQSAGIIYQPSEKGALENALRKIKNCDIASMSRQANIISGALDWKIIAQKTSSVYRAG
jgi:glycosyltransferase involved in cell wall biosynthesis